MRPAKPTTVDENLELVLAQLQLQPMTEAERNDIVIPRHCRLLPESATVQFPPGGGLLQRNAPVCMLADQHRAPLVGTRPS
jgi:hypothetical protein